MGRTKTYNEGEVLEKAMYCFWNNGYTNTSIRQLESEMGINQFSIYSSFGSKSNLYLKVLDKYVSMMNSTYLKDLSQADADIRDIERFLVDFGVDMVADKIPSSCLMIKSMINYDVFSPEIKESIDNFSKLMDTLFQRALKNSVAKGLLGDSISVKNESQYLLGITQSISIINMNKSKAEIKKYVANSIAKI